MERWSISFGQFGQFGLAALLPAWFDVRISVGGPRSLRCIPVAPVVLRTDLDGHLLHAGDRRSDGSRCSQICAFFIYHLHSQACLSCLSLVPRLVPTAASTALRWAVSYPFQLEWAVAGLYVVAVMVSRIPELGRSKYRQDTWIFASAILCNKQVDATPSLSLVNLSRFTQRSSSWCFLLDFLRRTPSLRKSGSVFQLAKWPSGTCRNSMSARRMGTPM